MSNEQGFVGDVTITLEDHGQDFLEFDVKDGRIADARPFQGWVWNGRKVMDKIIYPGLRIELMTSDSGRLLLRYPVESVRPLNAVAIGPTDI